MSKELLEAVKNSDLISVVNLLNKGADIHYKNDEAICLAASHGFFNMTRFLLVKGADVDSNNGFPIRIASKNGEYYIVELLLENNADVNIDDESALYNAIENSHCDIVKLLLDNGADVHNQDDLPLREAVELGNLGIIDCIKHLLDYGADIHIKNDLPLYTALYDGSFEIARLLISHGANVNMALKGSLTIKKDYEEYLKWEKENPIESKESKPLPIPESSKPIESEVIEPKFIKTKPISKREGKLDKGLIKAVMGSNLIDVIELLAHGADIHYQSDLALRVAAQTGNKYIFSYLLQNGADASVLDAGLNSELKQIVDIPHIAARYIETIKTAMSKRALIDMVKLGK